MPLIITSSANKLKEKQTVLIVNNQATSPHTKNSNLLLTATKNKITANAKLNSNKERQLNTKAFNSTSLASCSTQFTSTFSSSSSSSSNSNLNTMNKNSFCLNNSLTNNQQQNTLSNAENTNSNLFRVINNIAKQSSPQSAASSASTASSSSAIVTNSTNSSKSSLIFNPNQLYQTMTPLFTNNNLSKNSSVQLKTRRSGSITTFLPLTRDGLVGGTLPLNNHNMFSLSTNNGNHQSNNNPHKISQSTTVTHTTITPIISSGTVSFSKSVQGTANKGPSSRTSTNTLLNSLGKQHQDPTKRRKSNSISIIDYCNILNMNTNYQMLSNFYDDTEESMARLSLKTTRQGNIEKQASLSEQMAALFGSTMCSCSLCKLKSSNQETRKSHNFEILPHKHNSDFSVMTYSYSTPFSQLSSLKLFNLMNTDCSIYIASSDFNGKQTSGESFNQATNESSSSFLPPLNVNNNSSSIDIQSSSTSNSVITATSTLTQAPTNLQNFMHTNSNSPPIYDVKYLYLIDCRLNRKQFERSKISTAIYFEDILNDTVYLSPPTDNYTIIVLYDEDGTFLSSSSSSIVQIKNDAISCDDLIAKLKDKINYSQSKTIYILSGGFEQFATKFPHMCTHLDIRSTTDRHKFMTIYPNCVIENQIYIGSGIQAKNWKIIRDLKITHIINCSVEHECVFKDEITYLHIKIEDNYTENIYKTFSKALQFISDAFDKYFEDMSKMSLNPSGSSSEEQMGGNGEDSFINKQSSSPQPPVVLIHCNLGISRSSSVLIAYLIYKYKLCLYAAFKYVKDKRLQIAPNYSFLRQLKQFEETF